MAEEEVRAAKPEEKVNEKVNGAEANGVPAWDGKLLLRKQVIANGEPVMEITFREPTAGDIERIGNPVTMALFERPIMVHYDSAAMTGMMAHLAGVPPSTIRSMHPTDWNNGATMLALFFMPDRWQ